MKFYRVSQRYLKEIRQIDKHVQILNDTLGIIMRFSGYIYFVPVECSHDVKKSTPALLRLSLENEKQCQCKLSSMIPVPYHELLPVTQNNDIQLTCLSKNKQRILKFMKRLYNQKNKEYDARYLQNTVDFKTVEQFSIDFENKHINRFPDESYFLVNPYTTGENEYYLMNKNTKVAKIVLNNETNIVKEIIEIINEDYAPLECFENNILTKESITRWFKGRGIPSWRDGLDDFLENIGIQNKDILLNKAFGLSLSDQYWMNPVSMMMEWSDINFFHHDFNSNDYIQSIFLNRLVDINKIDFYNPNHTTDGMLKKTWIVEDNIRYLLKGSYKKMDLEPFNELLASWLCHALDLYCVDYSIDYIQSHVVSRCPCFINENTELISAYALLHYHHVDMNLPVEDIFNIYIQLLQQYIDNARDTVVRMFILDYIVVNEDRHLGNFGVIRDVNTLKIVSVAPNYDTGLSLYSQKEIYQMNFEKASGRFFNKEHYDFDCMLDIILKDYDINIDYQALYNVVEQFKELLIYHKDRVGIDHKRIEAMINGLHVRIDKLQEYTNRKQN